MNEVLEDLAYAEDVARNIGAGLCPVTTDIADDVPWITYCGDPVIPGTDTCADHRH